MRWLLIFVLSMNAAMCGQKGPLVLPESTERAQTSALVVIQ